MSYPFGSGMPPYPNSNSGPFNQGGPGYPTQGAPYPSAGFPNQAPYPQQSPFPSSNLGYPHVAPYPNPNANPNYPTHTPGGAPFGAGFYPPPSGYPPQLPTTTSPYPSVLPSSTNNAYPPSLPQSGYPSQSNSFLPAQGYPNPSLPQHQISSGYPGPAASNIASCFAEMQGHIRDTKKSKGNPTVVPAPNFDPSSDANALRKAMKGFGTDEDGLINIICRRSNEQRLMIQRAYKTSFGKDLIEDIQSETSGNFENLLVALLTPIVDFYVKELHDAMAGIGTDEDVLIEVLCSMSNYEIHTIKNAYERLYGKNLESELISETSGNFKRLLVSLCAGGRDESGVVDPEAAIRDATELLRAGELRAGTDESTFNMIFCKRSYAQIKIICDEYQRMTGHSLEKAIRNEFSGDILDGLIAILQCTSNKSEFFASRLHKSMAGIGTNDSQLIRLIVTRCEIDLNDIKGAFERLYGKSLRSWIKGDTSGHYKHALYALCGEQRSS